MQRWAFRALANALDSGGEAARVQMCGTGTSAAASEAVRALRQHQGTRAVELQVLYRWTSIQVGSKRFAISAQYMSMCMSAGAAAPGQPLGRRRHIQADGVPSAGMRSQPT